jgi:hypothetical protein
MCTLDDVCGAQARFDLQTAVAYWHNQVLSEFLASYTASNPASISFKQHVVSHIALQACRDAVCTISIQLTRT